MQKDWIKAIDLRAGDVLVLVNGEYVIVEWIQHEILEAPVKVFNLQVADYHTYFVTNDGILVHNACGDTGAYKELRTVEKGSGNEVHHIVEKRLINATKFSSANDMPSISLTKETHRQFTNAWRRALPYGKSYSPVEVLNAAKDVYADYPQLLKIAEGMIK